MALRNSKTIKDIIIKIMIIIREKENLLAFEICYQVAEWRATAGEAIKISFPSDHLPTNQRFLSETHKVYRLNDLKSKATQHLKSSKCSNFQQYQVVIRFFSFYLSSFLLADEKWKFYFSDVFFLFWCMRYFSVSYGDNFFSFLSSHSFGSGTKILTAQLTLKQYWMAKFHSIFAPVYKRFFTNRFLWTFLTSNDTEIKSEIV